MERKTLLLLISISVNIYLFLYIEFFNDKGISPPKSSNSECARQDEDSPINNLVVSDKEIDTIKALKYENSELTQNIFFLEQQRKRCAEELEITNLKLEISSTIQAEEENSISNAVNIDDDMPDDLQNVIATYSAYLISEETDQAWEMDVRNELDVIVGGEAFQGVGIVVPIECHTTLCKYEIEALDTNQADLVEAELTTIVDRLGGEVALYKHKHTDSLGSVRVIMYYAKVGYSLPVVN